MPCTRSSRRCSSSASRVDKGTHRAVARYERHPRAVDSARPLPSSAPNDPLRFTGQLWRRPCQHIVPVTCPLGNGSATEIRHGVIVRPSCMHTMAICSVQYESYRRAFRSPGGGRVAHHWLWRRRWSRGPPEESDYNADNPSLSKNARLRSFAATTNLSNEITST